VTDTTVSLGTSPVVVCSDIILPTQILLNQYNVLPSVLVYLRCGHYYYNAI